MGLSCTQYNAQLNYLLAPQHPHGKLVQPDLTATIMGKVDKDAHTFTLNKMVLRNRSPRK
jgi:hypothetical protein